MNGKPIINLILTRRCNARCTMCNCHLNPTKPEEEFKVDLIDKLPQMKSTTLTGGEPFLRADLRDVLKHLQGKTERILINTNGYYIEKICEICEEYPNVGLRISIDGIGKTHNKIRGVPDMYEHAVESIERLASKRGKRDLGISFCVQDSNCEELVSMFHWANDNSLEFAFSVVQNSSFFCKKDNEINENHRVLNELAELQKAYLRTYSLKNWARAYFVEGAMKYVVNEPKPLRCDAGRSSFFINPFGEVLPCNDFPQDMIMGNLNTQTWNEIINSEQSKRIVSICKNCSINCWSMCNIGSKLRRNLPKVGLWIVINRMKELK